MRFAKMNGSGNDHVVVEMHEFKRAVDLASDLDVAPPELVRCICNRRRGIGGDGVLIVGESLGADISMRTFNSDGSEAEMCGNGIRCAGKYAFEHGLVSKADVTVETASGVHTLFLDVQDGQVASVRVDMGVPKLLGAGVEEDISCCGGTISLTRISMGNPHAVVFTSDFVESIPLEEIAHAIEAHHDLFPNGTNVEVAHMGDDGRTLYARVFERGCGETESCGTGACAIATAHLLRCGSRYTDGPLEVCMAGGRLSIDWRGPSLPIFMSGPAEQVFQGEIDVCNLFRSTS